MIALALRSFAHHRTAAVATGLVAMAGTVLVTAMAGLLGTGLADRTAAADRDFLVQFPIIMGGWICAIVLFAMVSTIGVALQGRAGEIAGIRLVGATPTQVRRMVAAETAAVAVIAAVPGLGLGYLLGRMLLALLHGAGLTGDGTVFAPGALLPLGGAALVLAAGVAAAWLGSRTIAARSPVADVSPAPGAARRRSGRARRTAASIVIGAGLASSVTVLWIDPDNILTTALTGPGCVLVAAGLCVLAPELTAVADAAFRRFPGLRRTAPGHLAALNLAAAPERVRPTVTFLTLFVGVAAGTLGMQGIENQYGAADSTGQVMAAINYLVVVLIAAFMAIALSNNLIASIARRKTEFASMSLIGSTGRQSRRMLIGEAAAATTVSVVAGSAGALLSILPFAIVKTGDAWSALAPLPYLLAILVGAGVTLGVTAVAGRRAIRTA
jgi:putative ABC transport system permease protein